MREIGKILAYVCAVIVLGALLAVPLARAGDALADSGFLAGLGFEELEKLLAKTPFARFFNRAILVAALVLLVPWLRWLGLRRMADLGLQPSAQRLKDGLLGAGIALVGMALVSALILALGWSVPRATIRPERLLEALASGVAVGFLEEYFFRGALFGLLRRHLSWPKALAFLSVFFAVLHFLKPHRAAKKLTPDHWYSGFELLPYSVYRFKDPMLVGTGLVTLVIFGWILGYVVVKKRSLAMAIGLHGGWVFGLKAFSFTTKRVGRADWWLGKDLTMGIVPVTLLLLSLGFLYWLLEMRVPKDKGAMPHARHERVDESVDATV